MTGLGFGRRSIEVRPSAWFSEDELAAARRYHGPLGRAAFLRALGRLLLLVLVQLFLSVRLSDDTGPVGAFAVAAPLVAIAWWAPTTGVDVWFEYRHEPRFGHTPLPPRRFAVGSFGSLVLVMLSVGAVGGLTYVLMSAGWAWPALLALLAIVALGVFHRLEPRFTALAHNVGELSAEDRLEFACIAAAAGVERVEFHRMESGAVVGLNVLTTGGAGGRRVLLTPELLAAHAGLRRHVVAHELSHLALGHLPKTARLVGIVGVVGVGVLGLVTSWGLPFRITGIEDPGDPRGLATLTATVALLALAGAPLLAWASRAHERQADDLAFLLVGSVPIPLFRTLHTTARTDLDPGRISRLLSPHPPPAERLHRASHVDPGRVPS